MRIKFTYARGLFEDGKIISLRFLVPSFILALAGKGGMYLQDWIKR